MEEYYWRLQFTRSAGRVLISLLQRYRAIVNGQEFSCPTGEIIHLAGEVSPARAGSWTLCVHTSVAEDGSQPGHLKSVENVYFLTFRLAVKALITQYDPMKDNLVAARRAA